MRALAFLIVPALAWSASVSTVPNDADDHALHASADDLAAIEATAMNYAMSYYEGDGDRMESALHPHLAKRTIRDGERGQDLSYMSSLELVQIIRTGHGKSIAEADRQADVQILDVTGDVATIKLEMLGWIDYMHLAKVNDRWQIVNVLWRRK